ncbi:MAG: GIY-YIG nuclease family protein [Bacteroidales bacterium]|nr:GIY-YIG nuclease family protein [Bacteroidales bacterium]
MTNSYYAYVLSSEEFCRYYKGHSTDPDKRLLEHNNGKVKATKPYIPWKLVYFEEFKNRKLAIKREKYFKSAAGRRFLKNKL